MIAFVGLLLVSTLFGGMMLYSFGFAPMAFKALPAEDAGRFLRAAFPWYYLFIIVFAAAGAVILLARDWISAMLALDIALIAIYARQALMPRINANRDLQLQGQGEARERFRLLHGISVGLNMLQIFAAAYVLSRFL